MFSEFVQQKLQHDYFIWLLQRKHKESNIKDIMKLSDEDKKEPLKMEILKSETFLLETKYVNIEEDKDDEWTNI